MCSRHLDLRYSHWKRGFESSLCRVSKPSPSFQLFLSQLFGLKMVKQNFKATLISQPCWNATLNESAFTFDWQSIVLLQALICCSFCPPTHQMLLNLSSTITSNKDSRLIQNSEESIIYTNLDNFWTSQSKIRPARVKGWNILYELVS